MKILERNENKVDSLPPAENEWDLIVIGGGAAGFFGAIACAEARPGARVLILEATPRVLTKVKISGGGRCNVTHHQFDPKKLVTSYPRGNKELIGPFHRFQPQDTVAWFAQHGVTLVPESDGRMFPSTNTSQTIIDCLENAAQDSGVVVRKNTLVKNISQLAEGFALQTAGGLLHTRYVLLATGSMPYGVRLAADLGHTLVDPVPSLFTFEIQDSVLTELSGISFPLVRVTLKMEGAAKEFVQEGPCLITHWGLSGPAVLKLSAFAARELHQSGYQASIAVNWLFPLKTHEVVQKLEVAKEQSTKKKVSNANPFASCTQRFWSMILKKVSIESDLLFANVSKKQLQALAQELTQAHFVVSGKGVFKEEFVTAGGVNRDALSFQTMESKACKGLYFAGEVIDIDGITGGFNFQNAWTGGWLAGQDIARKI